MAALKFFANVSMHCCKVLIEIGGHLLIMRVSRLSTAVVGMLHSTTHRTHWKRWFVSSATKSELFSVRKHLLIAKALGGDVQHKLE
ncbi:hypothetical protein F443_02239 [Phytophthora nicotianae P1569]|uniref:Uncharacterized protein n=1 Tax=Phytophthora nicotianae P1569 TaxID=1317065 RepID=V9FWC2_PHYNI|nr:hypothetical protein F443_02239 [Phytophthora nicotianae P1569]